MKSIDADPRYENRTMPLSRNLIKYWNGCRKYGVCLSAILDVGMSDSKKGFYIFIAVTVIAVAVTLWGVLSMTSDDADVQDEAVPVNGYVAVSDILPASKQPMAHHVEHSQREKMDETLLYAALSDGAEPTQQMGERGSLNGALFTKYPMVYADSKYERLPHSPLIRFTDDMIWQTGENDYKVRYDAVSDQAKNISEASVALSVSPWVEYGKILGYRLVEIPDETLFSKIGLVSGDIVVTINGKVPDMEPMALMFVNMTAGKQRASEIEVDHRGVRRTIHLSAVE